jgi:hypothetical protein
LLFIFIRVDEEIEEGKEREKLSCCEMKWLMKGLVVVVGEDFKRMGYLKLSENNILRNILLLYYFLKLSF